IPGRHHGVSATAIERKKRGASRRIDDLQKEQKEAKKRKSRARALEMLSSAVADVVDAEKAALDLESKSRSAPVMLKSRFDSAIQDAERRAREMRAHAAQMFKMASEKPWPECELIIKEVVALLKEADAIAPEKVEKKQHDSKDVRYRLFANAARLEDYCDDDDENSRERPVC
ncbi:hypothetical protein, partial [Tepidimonas sediminis]|uniref:hypothetical protein n=1 Tax=Tepidimonas sediminis TaxID=2588941 RepID=UPI00163DE51D